MPSLRVLTFGTITALTVGIYCLYRYIFPGSKSSKLPYTPSPARKSPSIPTTNKNTIKREGQVTEDEIEYIVSSLSSANTTKFLKIVKTLINFTNFNGNLPAFRRLNTLNTLFSNVSLGGDGDFLKTVNIHILNLFSNLVVDVKIRQYTAVNIKRFFEVDLTTLDEEELTATLRLLGNLSLMRDGCDSVAKNVQYIYPLIVFPSVKVSRQVWTVLLNLSCDSPSIPVLLSAKVHSDVGDNIIELAFQNEDVAVCEKVTKFLCNVYANLVTTRETLRISSASLAEELLAIKENIDLQASLFLTSAITMNSESLFSDTNRLIEILEKL